MTYTVFVHRDQSDKEQNGYFNNTHKELMSNDTFFTLFEQHFINTQHIY